MEGERLEEGRDVRWAKSSNDRRPPSPYAAMRLQETGASHCKASSPVGRTATLVTRMPVRVGGRALDRGSSG